ncbi:MAG: divergent polysaccharide deacetylase family protein [Methylobacterium sp.]|jgi:polysaccharide deacetylase 2 family uncharacterized protein YibQ|nr:divergent polysaccharide deacetylase family protein [Methylobacterium sp.]
MAFESLATPLGTKPKAAGKPKGFSVPRVLLAVVAFGIALFLAYAALQSSRRSGLPVAVVPIERDQGAKGDLTRPPAEGAVAPAPPNPEGGRASAAQVETESGVRVVRQNGGQAPGAAVIRVPDAARPEGDRLVLPAAPDPRVVERIPLGLLPKVADDGTLPRQIYARPFASTTKPRIAVVLTGVGVSARSTTDAVTRLPGDFTLAFAPYGRDLEAQVMRARRDGHEVLLQIPMEPFDFPDSDPGPHTLRAGGSSKENIDRLHWLMTRFPGYVGLMNYLGGKLLSTPAALQPVLDEIGRRGLLFLDDGTTPRSVASDIGMRLNLPVLRADRAMDATGSTRPLAAILQEAEGLAQRQGRAVITVPALAANIETLINWEADLAQRNIVVAPLSAVLGVRAP